MMAFLDSHHSYMPSLKLLCCSTSLAYQQSQRVAGDCHKIITGAVACRCKDTITVHLYCIASLYSMYAHFIPWLFDLLAEWIPLSCQVQLLSPVVNAEGLRFVISASTTAIISGSMEQVIVTNPGQVHFIRGKRIMN